MFQRLFRDPYTLVGMAVLLVVLITAIIGPSFMIYDPVKMNTGERFEPPGGDHIFGTDHLGRDVFTRVVYGARISLLVAAIVSFISATLGLLIGGLSGYVGGLTDEAVMRITDIFLSFPWLIFAMAVAFVVGPSLWMGMVALSIVWWPGYARLVRGQVLSVKSLVFVEAARAIGAGDLRIFMKHVLPNCTGPYIVKLTIGAGRVILATSTLSFIGLGAQPPTPEWGAMVATGREVLFDSWWVSTFPGLAILMTVVGFNLLGDGLRDLLDPKGVVT
jgi:peptide/nickel transport system permease protein